MLPLHLPVLVAELGHEEGDEGQEERDEDEDHGEAVVLDEVREECDAPDFSQLRLTEELLVVVEVVVAVDKVQFGNEVESGVQTRQRNQGQVADLNHSHHLDADDLTGGYTDQEEQEAYDKGSDGNALHGVCSQVSGVIVNIGHFVIVRDDGDAEWFGWEAGQSYIGERKCDVYFLILHISSVDDMDQEIPIVEGFSNCWANYESRGIYYVDSIVKNMAPQSTTAVVSIWILISSSFAVSSFSM